MKIVILLLGLCILLLLYLIWILFKYIVALLYYHSLSAEDAEYMYKVAVGKDDELWILLLIFYIWFSYFWFLDLLIGDMKK